MDIQQKRILSENLHFFTNNLKVKDVIEYTREKHPTIIKDGDLMSLNMRKQDARASYLLDIFKRTPNGYSILYEILEATNHSHTVLKTLDSERHAKSRARRDAVASNPSKGTPENADSTAEILKQLQSISMNMSKCDQVVQSMSMNMARRDQVEEVTSNIDKLTAKVDKLGDDNEEMATKMDELSLQFAGFKEEMKHKFEMMEKRLESFGEIMLSDKKTSENIKKALETLSEEVKKFKEDYAQFLESYHQSQNIKESNEYEFFKTIVEKLTALDGTDKDRIWREITKLREDFNGLKKLTVSVWNKMQPTLPEEIVQDDDVRILAQKIKTIWCPLGQKVGVNITDLEGGECKMDVEGRAVAVLTRWLTKRDSGLLWEDLISVVSEIDENVADTIAALRSSNP